MPPFFRGLFAFSFCPFFATSLSLSLTLYNDNHDDDQITLWWMMFSFHKAEWGTTNGITGPPCCLDLQNIVSFFLRFLYCVFFTRFALCFLRILVFLWLFLGGWWWWWKHAYTKEGAVVGSKTVAKRRGARKVEGKDIKTKHWVFL